MTDPSDLDELASAHLDGATSPEDAARVEADPALRARVEELRRVRAALGVVPAVDATRRDAAIAAALAAFAEEGAREDAAPAARVTSLTDVRARRGPSPRSLKILGAAAAVAALALLAPVLGDLAQSDDSPSFEATGDALEDAAQGAADGGAGQELGGAEVSTTTAAPAAERADLGAFDDVDSLVATVVAGGDLAFAPGDAFSSPTEGAADDASLRYAECDRAREAEVNLAPAAATSVAVATVAGEPVVVVVRTADDGTRTLLVYELVGCDVLAERAL